MLYALLSDTELIREEIGGDTECTSEKVFYVTPLCLREYAPYIFRTRYLGVKLISEIPSKECLMRDRKPRETTPRETLHPKILFQELLLIGTYEDMGIVESHDR